MLGTVAVNRARDSTHNRILRASCAAQRFQACSLLIPSALAGRTTSLPVQVRFLARALSLRFGRLARLLVLKKKGLGKQVCQPFIRKSRLRRLAKEHAASLSELGREWFEPDSSNAENLIECSLHASDIVRPSMD